MLGAVRAALLRQRERHAGKLLEIVADAALDGARGNSGAILAQFLHGVCDASQDHRLLTTAQFVQAVERGSRYARGCCRDTREGTILTVIRDFAEELAAQPQGQVQDFSPPPRARPGAPGSALAATTAQLEALRRAGVVDAGAQGFVYLLAGVVRIHAQRLAARRAPGRRGSGGPPQASGVSPGLAPGRERPAPAPDGAPSASSVAENLDRRRLARGLRGPGQQPGDGGRHARARIHIHADDPKPYFASQRPVSAPSRHERRTTCACSKVRCGPADTLSRSSPTAPATCPKNSSPP
jgi:uncharacterized protein